MNPPEISKMSETKSAVLPLPRELRDCIYEYLLTRRFHVMNPRPQDVFSSAPLVRQPELAILIVSRSTHDEAKRIMYKHGRFQISALRIGSPPINLEVLRLPGLEQLQDIVIRVDTFAGRHHGYEDSKVIECGTTMINHFAKLDSSIPRKRCKIDVNFFKALDLLDVALEMTDGFKDAVGRLTGFKTVHLKMSYISVLVGPRTRLLGPRRVLTWLCTWLDEMLALKLGKGEQVNERTEHSWVYHPQQV